MTDRNSKKERETEHSVSVSESSVEHQEASTSKGRRALIKGAAGALPMILTLQSGAALARSSNLISSASPESAKDQYGRTLCMDGQSVYPVEGGPDNVYDMGEPPQAVVSAISDRQYYIWSQADGLGEVTTEHVCERGGYYFVKRRWGWGKVYVKRGMLVSATALSSFAGHIQLIDV